MGQDERRWTVSKIPKLIQGLADGVGGTIDSVVALPDGSGFATMTLPLPKDHWSTAEGFAVPPMPMRMGTDDPGRTIKADQIRAAARYAIRASTMNGKDPAFDPDAMVQNFVVGMLGYWTKDGLSEDAWANPATAVKGGGQ